MEFNQLPNEFYPTPPELVAKMISHEFIKEKFETILEPSAGKGDLIDFLLLAKDYLNEGGYCRAIYDKDFSMPYETVIDGVINRFVLPDFKKGKRSKKYNEKVDCIEADSNFCAILRGKEYRVYNDDFLKWDDDKHYDLIIMNPPFSNGDEHLLKAISIAEKTGSKIICLLNAETIKNPYSNKRKLLVNTLEKYNAEIKYVQDAFKNAERKTGVEVAIVRVEIPAPFRRKSRIWEELEQNDIDIDEPISTSEIVSADDPLRMAVKLYKRELEAGKKLIEEYLALKPYLTSTFENEDTPSYMRGCLLTLSSGKNGVNWNEYLYSLRYKYWYQLLHNPAFMNNLTSNLREEYYSMISEFAHKDFSLKNIYDVKMDIISRTAKGIEDKIVSMFESLSYQYSMDAAGNVHYFNGWKSNSAFKINKKVVIPYVAAWEWGKLEYYHYSDRSVYKKLDDLEKCLAFLQIGESEYVYDIDLSHQLKVYQEQQITRKMQFRYFEVDVFKKGTMHIKFRDLELLKRFNIFGCQHKGWLPPSYGRKSYSEMNQEEKQVIDEYEGQQEYEKVYANRESYILDVGQKMLLTDGN
ncbi:MAG: DUF4942 domain-containing protein [Alphaproteobacteria bacterium]|nr:DUF4942 domain-containing protein [Alphaproteobacteria bacterium]